MRFIMKYQMPRNKKMGTIQEKMLRRKVDSTSPRNSIWWPCSSLARSGVTRTVLKLISLPSLSSILPVMRSLPMAISLTLSERTWLRNSL